MSGEQIVENWNSQRQITNIAPLMISVSSSYVHAVWLWHFWFGPENILGTWFLWNRLFEIESVI